MSTQEDSTTESTPDSTSASMSDSTTVAQEPHLTPSPLPPPTCGHSVPPFVAPLLPNPKFCPVCMITRNIANIKDVQKVLRTRGGVFFSRGRPKSDKHRSLMDRWRKSKVQLLNLVSILETLILEHPTEEWKDVNESLGVWEQDKEGLAKVPGYVYEGEEVKLDEDVTALVNRMLEELRNSVLGLLLEDGPEVVVAMPGGSESEIATSTSTSAASSTSISIAIPEHDSTPMELTLDASSSTLESGPRSRSILKRKPGDLDSPPTARKRVRTADFATVSSEHLTISNPSPFLKLSTDVTVQPHSESTSAEYKRRKSFFYRPSESYLPGAWASPAYSSKPNTSCFKLDWDEVEALWKEEEEEVAEEKRVHERLRVIAEVHVMSWWVRGVAGHVGLEKVASIGQAVVESNETASDGSDGVA
ncbi:hypothetical protein K505DRAFT_326637 [Melanomma pulvis-pyrius CBS 109.77]|uniref:Uncharacterized protein n=1 Tax=Melanomma pulvis-pyrius CBS 109.77 TaxID=1314802 RepID=A0A6A6X735_9PLEO|nr:hypothetical protein K505DRAFT_326637 [Melanomma pulvis-pyrius CBS 109.77]